MLKKLWCFIWGCKFTEKIWVDKYGSINVSEWVPLPFCPRCYRFNPDYHKMCGEVKK